MAEAILALEGIHKRFGGLQALEDVSLSIRRGEIYGLIGPNGAGKTTLFNILTGLTAPDSGQFQFNGLNLYRQKPHRIVQCGIARTFQNIRLFQGMTALENVMVGRHARSRCGVLGAILRTPAARREETSIRDRASALLRYCGIQTHSGELAGQLCYGDQRRLEIARALATDPILLALDEPAAGMNSRETEDLRALLLQIRRDGVTLLLIEHDVKLVMGLCDRIAVLDYGRKIAEDTPEQVRRNPRVIEAYLGIEHPESASPHDAPLPRQAATGRPHP